MNVSDLAKPIKASSGLSRHAVNRFWLLFKPWLSTWWPAMAGFVAASLLISEHFSLSINLSNSLPHRLYWVDKRTIPGHGEFAVFKYQGGAVYPKGIEFIKQIAGVAGDEVLVDANRHFIVLHKSPSSDRIPVTGQPRAHIERIDVGLAKRFGSVGTMAGRPIELGFSGVIPEGFVFVRGWAADSLDSRYALVGLVKVSDLSGKAIALF